jgi:excisionase family DNA binding protein
MVSTKLITIREAANRLGLKESTIRKAILKRQIAYVKPSVRAVRIPIEELERILAAGLRPVIPQPEVPDEPLEGVPAGARRRRMDEKQKRGYHRVRSLLWFWECHQFQVLWVTLSTAEGGDAEKLTYHHKQLRQRIERQLGFRGWSITRSGRKKGMASSISSGPGGCRMGNALVGSGSPRNGSRPNGKPSMGLRSSGSRPISPVIVHGTVSVATSSANTFRINVAT